MQSILETIFQIASILWVIVLVWYTVETYKIRITSELQLKTLVRPYLAYLQDPVNWTVQNPSQNIALNVFLLTKIDWKIQISKDKESVTAIGSGEKYTFTRNEMQAITKEELIRRIPSIEKYAVFLSSQPTNCLSAIYEDINWDKMYTITFGSGDQMGKAGVTGYVNSL
jgi:hypothetical protein